MEKLMVDGINVNEVKENKEQKNLMENILLLQATLRARTGNITPIQIMETNTKIENYKNNI